MWASLPSESPMKLCWSGMASRGRQIQPALAPEKGGLGDIWPSRNQLPLVAMVLSCKTWSIDSLGPFPSFSLAPYEVGSDRRAPRTWWAASPPRLGALHSDSASARSMEIWVGRSQVVAGYMPWEPYNKIPWLILIGGSSLWEGNTPIARGC